MPSILMSMKHVLERLGSNRNKGPSVSLSRQVPAALLLLATQRAFLVLGAQRFAAATLWPLAHRPTGNYE